MPITDPVKGDPPRSSCACCCGRLDENWHKCGMCFGIFCEECCDPKDHACDERYDNLLRRTD